MKKIYFLSFFVFTLLISISLIYYYDLVEYQTNNQISLMQNQARSSTRLIENYFTEFEEELNVWQPINDEKLLIESDTNQYIYDILKKFYFKHFDIINEISVYDDENNYILLNKNSRGFFNVRHLKNAKSPILNIDPSMRISSINNQFIYVKPIYLGEKIKANIIVKIDITPYVLLAFEDYYIGKDTWKWLFNKNGELLQAYDLKNKALSNKKIKIEHLNILPRSIDSWFEGYIKHRIQYKGENYKVISTYFPVTIFNTKFGIGFSISEESLYDSIQKNVLKIVILTILLLIAITIVFSIFLWQQKRNQNKIAQKAEEQRVLLSNIPAFVYFKDKNHKYVTSNEKFAELHDINFSEITGKSDYDLYEDKLASQRIKEDLRIFRTGHAIHNIERETLGKDNKTYWYSTSKVPYKDINGKVLGIVGITWDITDQKKNEEDLINAKQEAEASNKVKSEFLANMSHEIRTPINAVVGFADLIKEKVKDENIKGYIEAITSSSNSLLLLINDLLDLSKIEAGKLEIIFEPINTNVLFKEVENMFMIKAKEKNLGFNMEIDKDMPQYIHLDETRIRQILINLIGNAIKFTEKGYVNVVIKTDKIDIQRNLATINISIKDTGIGIKNDEKINIFDSFRQQQGQSYRRYEGSGLGLTITKKLTEMMGGKISVESELNEGSIFTITIPNVNISKSIDNKEIYDLLENKEVIFKKSSILIIDDNEVDRHLFKESINSESLVFYEASIGENGIRKAIELTPNIIVIDLMLPQIDGWEICKSLKSNTETKNIPIIALSSMPKTNNKKLIEQGFSGYITKPFSKKKIISELINFLEYDTINKQYENIQTDKFSLSDDLVNLSINDENRNKFPEIISNLENTFVSLYDNLLKTSKINDIESFAKEIIIFGEKNNIKILKLYGVELSKYVDSFDIENMNKTIDVFPKILKKIKKLI